MKFLRFNSPKYYGQFDPPIDKVLHERYFKKWKTPGFFIECGAYDGVEESSCYFFEKHLGWSGLNVEAVPQSFKALQKNRPSAINVHCALSSENGEAEFRNAIHPQRGDKFGNGSLKHTLEHSRVLEEQGCVFETFKVPTETYTSLITRLGIQRVDLMVLDVEGHELEVLKGMSGAPTLPAILVVEHGQLGLPVISRALEPIVYRFDYESFVNSVWILDRNKNLSEA